MKHLLFLLQVCIVCSIVAGQTILDECGVCRQEDCPLAENCAAGVVKDKCGCCLVCARSEGEKCDNFTLPLPYKYQYGFCGDNLICQLRRDLTNKELPEALCVCKDTAPVCGSDGQTYTSVCKLRETRIQKADLALQEWGPCKSAPIITSGPEDIEGNIKENLAFGCEAKGYPIPVLQWEYESSAGVKTKLPSDDQMIAVQVRGGPEAYMITSWVQVMELRPSDAGTYTCLASNSEGEAKVSAQLTVVKVRTARNVPTSDISSRNANSPLETKNKENSVVSTSKGDKETVIQKKQHVVSKKRNAKKRAQQSAYKKATSTSKTRTIKKVVFKTE